MPPVGQLRVTFLKKCVREGSLPALLLPTLEVCLDGGNEPGGEAVAVRGEGHGLQDGRGQDGVAF